LSPSTTLFRSRRSRRCPKCRASPRRCATEAAGRSVLHSVFYPSRIVIMDTRTWLQTLVGIDTTSRNSNLGLIETVRDNLKAQGVHAWLAHNADGSKANLFATLPASDGGEQGGIVLSGHTDVVPVDGQAWSTDPFVLSDADGRLYGRGSCDMKGFIAAALALVPEYL